MIRAWMYLLAKRALARLLRANELGCVEIRVVHCDLLDLNAAALRGYSLRYRNSPRS
jgi:hypothetical protein